MLTHNEALVYLKVGMLPKGFRTRVKHFVEYDPCPNCDDVRCMHFVMRDWWDNDFNECDGWCCPFCSDLKPKLTDTK